ncbi:MAG: restriction endonuclease subunit S [Sarcina sp.]
MNKSVPKLRFKEFEGEWKEVILSSLFDKIRNSVDVESNKKYKQIGIRSHGKGIFYKDEVLGEELGNKRVFWIEPNVFIVNIVFAWERAIARTTEKERGMIASHRFPMYKPKKDILNLDYITYFFKTNRGQSLLELASPGGAGRNKTLGQKEFDNLKFRIPTLKEQEKIARVLKSVDSLIEEQDGKVSDLELYKKGMMQKIFSQEIRFKDENGNIYPTWNITNIEEIAQIKMGFTPSTKDDGAWGGDIEWLSIAGMTNKYIYSGNKKISNELLGKRTLVPEDTLIMSFKLTIGRLAIVKKELMTNEAICQFYWKNKNILNEYMYGYLSTVNIASFGCRAAKGITLNTESLNSIVVKLPCIEEQKKIADFLFNIDNLLEEEKKNLDDLREMKKGLLQQMFV